MDVASIASQAIATQMTASKQEMQSSLVKQSIEGETQAAQALSDQAVQSAKAATSGLDVIA